MKLSESVAMGLPRIVAPHTGAWIETYPTSYKVERIRSHPTRVRGLKRNIVIVMLKAETVAPHTGAWIETTTCCSFDII